MPENEFPGEPIPVERLGILLGNAYDILSLVSSGADGACYRAVERKLGREVSITVSAPIEGPHRKALRERFFACAKVMANLHHENLAGLYDFGELSPGQPYVVLEGIRGESLREILSRGLVPLPRILEWMQQLALGLQRLHERNLVHLAIEPGNLWIEEPEGRLRIGPFGIDSHPVAARERPSGPGHEEGGFRPPDYSAPECLGRGGEIDTAADLYSLGVIFYELLTGKIPGPGAPRPSHLVPYLDPRIDALVTSCLHEDPGCRVSDARRLAAEIGELRSETEVTGPKVIPNLGKPTAPEPVLPPAKTPRHGKQTAVLLAGIGLLAIAATAFAVISHFSGRARISELEKLSKESAETNRDLGSDLAGLRLQHEDSLEALSKLQEEKETLTSQIEDLREKAGMPTEKEHQLEMQLQDLSEKLKKADGEKERINREFEEYKRNYRAEIRKKAPGTRLGQLDLPSGQSLQDVEIVAVTEAYINVKHRSGLASVPFGDLPDALRNKYAYSPELAAAELAGIRESARLQGEANAASLERSREIQAMNRLEGIASRLAALRTQAATIEARIANAETDRGNIRTSQVDKNRVISGLQRDLQTINNQIDDLVRQQADTLNGR